MSGIERNVDKLGRVVIPISYREKLGIKTDDTVVITLRDEFIAIAPSKKICSLCGKGIEHTLDISACDECIKRIKEM